MKISEYTKIDVNSMDYALVHRIGTGTYLTNFEDAVHRSFACIGRNNRNMLRGKYLGETVTTDQLEAIYLGTFKNLYVGDYWRINGIEWQIVDMDYWYGCGDTKFDKHHLVIMPRGRLCAGTMNDQDTTAGGYVGSKMYTSGLYDAKETIINTFGDLLLTRREYLIDEVTNGYASGGNWYDSQVELPDEIMVYGCRMHSPTNDGSAAQKLHTTSKTQLALFRIQPYEMFKYGSFWLRDVVSNVSFANVQGTGLTSYAQAAVSVGVRPVFALGPSSDPSAS